MDAKKEDIDDSESIASDESEEMTEVDDEENDLKRAKYVDEMKELEIKYNKLKEEWINTRYNDVENKLKEIEDETAEEFTKPLKKLQMNMEKKTNNSTLIKDYRLRNIEHVYECEIESDKLSLENNMNSLIEKYKTKIQCEIKHLEESRRQFLLDYELYKLTQNDEEVNNEQSASSNALSNRKKSKNSPVILTGTPYVVYTLPENEILEDLSLIKMHNNLNSILNNSES